MSDSEDLREKFRKPLQRPGTLALPSQRADVPAAPPAAAARPQLPVPVAAPAMPAEAPPPAGGLAGMLVSVARMLQPRPPALPPAPAVAVEPAAFTLAVAALIGEDGGRQGHIMAALDSRPGLKVKALYKTFPLDSLEDPAQTAAAAAATRHAVAGEKADVLLWGMVSRDGYHLHLTTPFGEDERAGAFGMTTRIELPLAFPEPAAQMLHAAVLAAAEATGEVQKGALRRHLPAAALQAEALALRPPVAMSMPQQRSVQMVFGHIAVACARWVPPSQAGGWFDKALAAYRSAEKRLARTDPPWETGLIHKHIALLLSARAESDKGNLTLLHEAVAAWREAVAGLARNVLPQEWAQAQVRLGRMLYRLDLATGDTDLLREALPALQGALQVYSRTETPVRWAEAMHDIAQVLEVYGDQLKSADVLRRAVDTCRQVLEVQSRERTPLAWAAAQNTLGSALFLLDKHQDGVGHLPEAAAAFEAANEIFHAYGRKGPAQVAMRNLGHVKRLAEQRRGRHVFDDWAEE
ncbi:MAG: hypothetical protein HY985_07475 [Magnetospirillum sp.]|nr:hypothetical protein [Magnetospirillum sp.]